MMKRLNIILGILLAAVLVSCNGKAEFKTYSYVAFTVNSYSVKESAESLTIPVTLTAKDASISSFEVFFEVEDGTAEKGTHFNVYPADGILEFDASNTTQYITVVPVNYADEAQGNKRFTINLTSLDGNCTIGGLHSTTVLIKDDNHPYKDLIGTYQIEFDYNAYEEYAQSWEVTIEPDDSSNKKLWIDNLTYFMYGYASGQSLYFTVADDLKTFTIPLPQTVEYGGSEYYVVTEDSYMGYNDSGYLFDTTNAVSATFTYYESYGCWYCSEYIYVGYLSDSSTGLFTLYDITGGIYLTKIDD